MPLKITRNVAEKLTADGPLLAEILGESKLCGILTCDNRVVWHGEIPLGEGLRLAEDWTLEHAPLMPVPVEIVLHLYNGTTREPIGDFSYEGSSRDPLKIERKAGDLLFDAFVFDGDSIRPAVVLAPRLQERLKREFEGE